MTEISPEAPVKFSDDKIVYIPETAELETA